MHESWKKVLAPEFAKDYFQKLADFVQNERRNYTIYPPQGEVFNAFAATPYDHSNVLILGQDPYHSPGQAHGLCFSVREGVRPPPSLVNVYKELTTDLMIPPAAHGHLQHWAGQGVLLLNSVLTVRAGEPGSHQGHGWEQFTNSVIQRLNEREQPVVFVLWGRYAAGKRMFVDESRHTVIESAHPSPMSADRGFFGSRPFSRTNAALEAAGLTAIDWRLPTCQ